MAKDDLSARLEELRNKDHIIWSISRLNTFNTCQLGYYIAYVLKNRGGDNIYSHTGKDIHDILELIHLNQADTSVLKKVINTSLLKADLLDLKFPSEIIGNAWRKDMEHFAENFKRLDGDFATERGFVFELDENYFQGFIDAITMDENGEVVVLDWKSSGFFKGDKLKHAGRQLVLYKLALEHELGVEIKKLAWVMLKYVDVYYDGKKKTIPRRNIVKELKNLITTQLKKMGMSQFEIDMKLGKAIADNSFDVLPQEVKDRFEIKDCILYYDIDDKIVEETRQYLKNTIAEIESKNKDDENDWSYIDLNNDKERFFCDTLCSNKDDCPAYQEWLER